MDLPAIRTFDQQCSDFFVLQNGTPPSESKLRRSSKRCRLGVG
jgi:hypothetical protein